MKALRSEIAKYADTDRLSAYEFHCGYFGGGTPSAIEANALVSVLRDLRSALRFVEDPEITVEVNPISFTHAKAEKYFDEGVNRISFGAQSFNDKQLRTIGRPHRRGDVEDTLRVIQGDRL